MMLNTKKTLGTALITGLLGAFSTAAVAGDFTIVDTDASGGLSYAEVIAVAPDVSEEEFVTFDVDGTGELSETEYEEWKASKTGEAPQEEGEDDDIDGDDEGAL